MPKKGKTEKPEKKEKKRGKALTAEKLAKLGVRETRLAAKIGKEMVSTTDTEKQKLLGEIQLSLTNAGTKLLQLSKL